MVALVQMVVIHKKCHLPVILCRVLWMLPVLLLYKHANECCDEYLPLVFAQILMWSSLVLFLLTCNTWDSKQKIKTANKSAVIRAVLCITDAFFTSWVEYNKDHTWWSLSRYLISRTLGCFTCLAIINGNCNKVENVWW